MPGTPALPVIVGSPTVPVIPGTPTETVAVTTPWAEDTIRVTLSLVTLTAPTAAATSIRIPRVGSDVLDAASARADAETSRSIGTVSGVWEAASIPTETAILLIRAGIPVAEAALILALVGIDRASIEVSLVAELAATNAAARISPAVDRFTVSGVLEMAWIAAAPSNSRAKIGVLVLLAA